MKQKLLLTAGLLSATLASAQSQSVVFKTNRYREAVEDKKVARIDHSFIYAADEAANKTTTGNTKRWYSYFETVDTFLLNQNLGSNLRAIPIWFDSTVTQRFSTGIGVINFSGVYQAIDPIYFNYYNSRNFYPGAVHVRATDAYSVDSIYIDALYERLANKANVVDTVILSVTYASQANNNHYWRWNRSTSPWVSNYIPTSQDTLYGASIKDVDSINRTAYIGTGTVNPGVVWKMPLRLADSASNGKTYFFKVGGPNGTALNVPANSRVAISATFKSGDTWNLNVDSFNMHNNWRPITSNNGNNVQMPYYWFDYSDHNMSGLMFSTDPSFYSPSVAIEGTNTTGFAFEFHSMGAKVTCTGCRNVGVAGAMELIANATIYPNPANSTVNVPVSMKADANVVVSITNTMGQTLMSQNLGKVAGGTAATAAFCVSALPTGMYFYTVEANGRRITNRFNVSH